MSRSPSPRWSLAGRAARTRAHNLQSLSRDELVELILEAAQRDEVLQARLAFGSAAPDSGHDLQRVIEDTIDPGGYVFTGRPTPTTPAELDAALSRFGPVWVVTSNRDAARIHAMTLLDTGHPVLLESFLDGPEVSLFCLVDGCSVVPLLPAQDFKRVGEDDAGRSTRPHRRGDP